jgi:hypothetical protein
LFKGTQLRHDGTGNKYNVPFTKYIYTLNSWMFFSSYIFTEAFGITGYDDIDDGLPPVSV